MVRELRPVADVGDSGRAGGARLRRRHPRITEKHHSAGCGPTPANPGASRSSPSPHTAYPSGQPPCARSTTSTRTYTAIKIAIHAGGSVMVDYRLMADAVTEDNLREAVTRVIMVADEIGPMLSAVYGGADTHPPGIVRPPTCRTAERGHLGVSRRSTSRSTSSCWPSETINCRC